VPVQGSSRRKYLYPDQSPPNSASGTLGAVDTNGVSTESAADAVYDLQPAWVRGSISRRDARYLHERALAATGGPLVEIGTAAGVSTAILGAAAGRRSSGSRVASYDISPTYYADESRRTGDAAREMLDADRLGLVEFRNPATALDVRDEHPEASLGFVFIDAAHTHPWPALDLLAVLPCLRPGAEVVMHDINLPLVDPSWQTWGVKHLFDELDVEKRVDQDSDPPNIGSITVPAQKDALRGQALEVIAGHETEAEVPEETLLTLTR
jgi:predicted O-methyltransferase YrrM